MDIPRIPVLVFAGVFPCVSVFIFVIVFPCAPAFVFASPFPWVSILFFETDFLRTSVTVPFLFFVFFVSIILFFFIRVENPVWRVGLRILLMPVVAGISYEIIRLAGRSDSLFVRILSAPGMAIQRMSTKEPDREMVEVAVASVEAVFDWKTYLKETFGYEFDQSLDWEEQGD